MAARGGGGRRARSASAWDMGTVVSGAGGASMNKDRAPQSGKLGGWRGGGLTGGMAGCAALRLSYWGPSPRLSRPGAPPLFPRGRPLQAESSVDSGAQTFTSAVAPPPADTPPPPPRAPAFKLIPKRRVRGCGVSSCTKSAQTCLGRGHDAE